MFGNKCHCYKEGPLYIYAAATHTYTELQIKGGTEDNLKIIFLISQQKHTL